MSYRLASPHSELKPYYPVVVVGSGYGAAIAASRLARAGQKVCVLERGKEFQPGEFPDCLPEFLRETQADAPQGHTGSHTGLYDFRINEDMSVLVGCGLGGTSLINANVALQAEPRVFEDPVWPAALRADVSTLLEEGYARAREMLRPARYPHPVDSLPKLRALRLSAQALGARFDTPPINVNFNVSGPNHVGVEQKPCTQCGDCVSGCNHGAKNTLMVNYLPDAKNHGAEIFTQVSVHHLERKGGKWLVHYQVLDAGREKFHAPTLFVTADVVVLGAGTLGSTEILLRSRQHGLPLSPVLGRRFSGNGDVLGFSYNGEQAINGIGLGHRKGEDQALPVGPCITGMIDTRRPDRPLPEGLIIEEGSIPGAIGGALPHIFAATAMLQGNESSSHFMARSAREVESLVGGPYIGAMKNTQTFLVMGHDDAGGQLYLEDDRLRVAWPGVGKQPLFQRIHDTLQKVSRPLAGAYVKNPLSAEWAGQDLVTVHPLGGCSMGEDFQQGVVNHKGQVFCGAERAGVYEGLYVADGSIIPRPVGLNPLLTISALAERSMALLAQDRGWTIDYTLKAPPRQPAQQRKLSLQFTETMKGHISTWVLTGYHEAEEQGQADKSPFEFVLTVSSDDLDALLSSPKHEARMVGTVMAPALSPKPLTVTDGVFNLFVDEPNRVETKTMLYEMKLTSEEGKVWHFQGFKVIHSDSSLSRDLWDDTTTLYTVLLEGGPQGAVVGKGILRIRPADFARQLTTLDVRNARNEGERLSAIARFGELFAGMLYDVYGSVMVPYDTFQPPRLRKKRPLRAPVPAWFPLQTEDGAKLLLTRYQGGNKGPVLLAHGLGVSGAIFALDTVETNLVEYLCAHGYDVWNLESRASIDLPSSREQFSLDEVARFDYPAAVKKIRAETGAQTVQVLAHCFGAQTLTMSMLGGWLKDVRSVVLSQISAHVQVPPLAALKSGLHVPGMLDNLGVRSLTAYAGQTPSWLDRLYDAALTLHPIDEGEACKSQVCRRITFMYGHLYEHQRMNEATHATLHETFGVANIRAMEHLALCVREGQIVDQHGKDVYLPHPERMKLPIAFIHGSDNRCFLPKSTQRTYEWLCQANGSEGYARHIIPAYGHIDCWMGKDAYKDVFPHVLEHFEATQR